MNFEICFGGVKTGVWLHETVNAETLKDCPVEH